MDKIINKSRDLFYNTVDTIDPVTGHPVSLIITVLIISMIVIFVAYTNNYIKAKKSSLCKTININNTNTSIAELSTKVYNNKLSDFYIKTAYNCCATGNLKHSYVSECMLQHVLKQGVRCLDFEVYSIDNKPVIAVSSTESFYFKESYNDIPFDTVLETIKYWGLNHISNRNDPLFLHFRIKSTNKLMYHDMYNSLKNKISDKLCQPKYAYEYSGNNLAQDNIGDFIGKIIIMVDKSNPVFEDTSLNELVNFTSGSPHMRNLKDYDIKYTHNSQELINFNKKNFTITSPDLQSNAYNVSAALHTKYGTTFVGMCYQVNDINLVYYNKIFNDSKSAFALKPDNLRYKETYVNVPDDPSKNLSYQTMDVSSNYYSFSI